MSRTRTGFAMIEVVMATAIIGGLAVGALTLVASAAQQKTNAANLARGQMLCRSLAEEISTRPVADWSSGGLDIDVDLAGVNIKIKGSDAKTVSITGGTGKRSGFTTIDDYTGYTESTITDEDGNTISGYSGWSWRVGVKVADIASPSSDDNKESGLRRVTVESYFQGRLVATTTFLRSSEWERVQP
ncbi:MAG: prepilin-type N-terminal cleavage/methylation domain-containing protein [Phycisphaerales bacterium]|nr:prepilin-type N-terminal cleavage/methylation domain-containing protein [Phycisphaerales bacterium]MCB9836203.1 prepilin-type N-terminal cleavage/methylation domain-containing protein [Phycisphaera sp.]